MANPHHNGAAYRTARALMFARHGDMCHLCGHPGARQADYLVPVSVDPTQRPDADLMRPAHGGGRPGTTDNPCPVCGRRCNQSKGNRVERVLKTSRAW